MNINRLFALVFLVAFLGATLGAAHMWRYEPLPSPNDAFDYSPVWDRWKHRRCVVSINDENELFCSMDEFTSSRRQ